MENAYKQTGLFRSKLNREMDDVSFASKKSSRAAHVKRMTLKRARINMEYTIKAVETNNNEVQDFLFTLGCYAGETITVISILGEQYVVVVKDARYSIDQDLAECIII